MNLHSEHLNADLSAQPPPLKPMRIVVGAIKYLLNVIAATVVQLLIYATILGVVAGAIWCVEKVVDHFKSNNSSGSSQPYSSDPPDLRLQYMKPRNAPNGRPWPSRAAYVSGYPRLNQDGLSTVTVDNSQNSSDVFVKLVSLDGEYAYPVRQIFIPAFGRFAMEGVTKGEYDVRYRDLDTGNLSRSESFRLDEVETSDGVKYSDLAITLYRIRGGNMKTYKLSESEF